MELLQDYSIPDWALPYCFFLSPSMMNNLTLYSVSVSVSLEASFMLIVAYQWLPSWLRQLAVYYRNLPNFIITLNFAVPMLFKSFQAFLFYSFIQARYEDLCHFTLALNSLLLKITEQEFSSASAKLTARRFWELDLQEAYWY